MKLIKLLILFTVSIATISVASYAYAEQVDVPFAPAAKDCVHYPDSDPEKYACVWLSQNFTDIHITVKQDNLTEAEIKVLDDIEEARENGTYVEPPRYDHKWGLPTEEEDTYLEEKQKQICNKNKLQPSEEELCRLLGVLNLCYQGYGKLETIQGVRSFEVTLLKPSIWKNYDLKTNTILKNVKLAYEECRATHTVHDVILSEMYANFIVDGVNDPAPHHSEYAKHQTPFASQVITERTWLHTLGNAYDAICYGDNYSDSFKKQQGCIAEPLVECYMPTDVELLAWYKKSYPQFADPSKPTIKEHYQSIYDECMEKLAHAPAPLDPGWYDDYLNSSSPMQRFNAYQDDPVNFKADQTIYGKVGDWKVFKGKQK